MTNNKDFLFVVFFLFCLGSAALSAFSPKTELNIIKNTNKEEIPLIKGLVDNKVTSFYAGCIEGGMILFNSTMYKRPEGKTPQEVIGEFVRECHERSEAYRRDLQ